MATHVVMRRFQGPGGELAPGQLVRCEGDEWKNTHTLESARYLRPVTPADLESAGQASDSEAPATPSARSRRGKGKAA